MKKYFVLISVILLAWSASPTPTKAQEPTPFNATGTVTGRIINQNKGTSVTDNLEVMLHILDEQYVGLDMLHAQSQSDGTFRFTGVAMGPGRLYAVMATFDEVVYSSNTASPQGGSNDLVLDVPVYETTPDLSAVQIDQMHILFNFATDGLETTEIYALSNSGNRTVKAAVTLDDGKIAALRFPLPEKADFIFFQPDEQDRFIKFQGGFADSAPVLPGPQTDRFTVKYLVPFLEGQTYSFTAPLNIKTMDFLLPKGTGVSLAGKGLVGPQPISVDSGAAFIVYSYSEISAGQTVKVTFSGKPVLGSQSRSNNQALPLALGGGLLGLVMVGVGIWWRFRPEDVLDEEHETDANSREPTLDDLITQIAHVDGAFERGELDKEKYHRERNYLHEQAKCVMDEQERPKA